MAELSLGQVWVCNASQGIPPLLCIVGKLDVFGEEPDRDRVVSILVTPHPEAKKSGWPTVYHMPIFEHAFQRSDLRLTKHSVGLDQDFYDGYAIWLTAYHKGNAGVFSFSVSKAYSAIIEVKDTY